MYQSLFVDVADSFIEYIHLLDVDEIQQLDGGLKTNGWRTKSLLKIENAYELLTIFQMFYYFNGRLPLKNSLLNVPDGETPEGKRDFEFESISDLIGEMCFKIKKLNPFKYKKKSRTRQRK